MANTEINYLDPQTEQVKLASGLPVELESLRTRQFLKLLRIVTHGALPLMQDFFNLDPDVDPAEFTGRLIAMLVMSIPDAEDETIDFVRAMCRPVGLVEGRKVNKADTERNTAAWATLDAELYNPELDDLVTIIEAIVKRESADIQALGKRLGSMFRLAQRTGQAPQAQSSQNQSESTPASSEDSPEPSTSSPTSTDGETTTSSTSPSDDSASAWQPSANATTTAGGSDSNG